jgi:hypothetical protein
VWTVPSLYLVDSVFVSTWYMYSRERDVMEYNEKEEKASDVQSDVTWHFW